MRPFDEECADLAPLETFEPSAFEGTAEVPQHVCNLVLALALFYNDYKDALFASIALGDAKPAGSFERTRLWGAHSGMEFHAIRLQIGLLHELFKLVRDSTEALNHPFMLRVAKRLPSASRDAWDSLLQVAKDATPTDDFGRSLLRVRHKISFHYDPKEIFRGYRHHFLSAQKRDERPFISRGLSMSATRFYFADAAAVGYLRAIEGDPGTEEVMRNLAGLVRKVNMALMSVVEVFIQLRGVAYRGYRE
jgi:hypothetical protein